MWSILFVPYLKWVLPLYIESTVVYTYIYAFHLLVYKYKLHNMYINVEYIWVVVYNFFFKYAHKR